VPTSNKFCMFSAVSFDRDDALDRITSCALTLQHIKSTGIWNTLVSMRPGTGYESDAHVGEDLGSSPPLKYKIAIHGCWISIFSGEDIFCWKAKQNFLRGALPINSTFLQPNLLQEARLAGFNKNVYKALSYRWSSCRIVIIQFTSMLTELGLLVGRYWCNAQATVLD